MIGRGTFKRRHVKDWAAEKSVVAQNGNGSGHLTEETRSFYHHVVMTLNEHGIPYLLGGAYAFGHYTGIDRHTKDLDLFIRAEDCVEILDIFERQRYNTEITFRHWIGKVWTDTGDLIDLIYGSGNGVCEVDDDWFRHADSAEFLGLPVRVVPCEEMIWSKGYILERNRFDGADVAHLLKAQGPRLNWRRLIDRFGAHWRVLYVHLVLFGFIYPSEQDRIPSDVLIELSRRLRSETDSPAAPARHAICQGTLFSHTQYKKDLEDWGYRDARLRPVGSMTAEDIRQWTAAFSSEKP